MDCDLLWPFFAAERTQEPQGRRWLEWCCVRLNILTRLHVMSFILMHSIFPSLAFVSLFTYYLNIYLEQRRLVRMMSQTDEGVGGDA